MPRENLLAEAQALYDSVATPVVLAPSSPRPLPKCDDPRLTPPKPAAATLDPALMKRIESLSRELEREISGEMTPERAARLQRDPRFRELEALGKKLEDATTPPGMDAWLAKREAYDAQTKRWLMSEGWRGVRGIRGRAALIERSGARAERVTLARFQTVRAYYDSGVGRLCFTGGCTLLVATGEGATRVIERANPAVTQFFVGREGYVLKFQGIKVEEASRPQPLIWFGLLAAHLDGVPTVLGNPGESHRGQRIVGYPFSGKGKSQAGAVSWPDPFRPGEVSWSCAWDFQPSSP